jgi:hypothetical protein
MMYGQLDSNSVFEKSYGTWRIPIDGVIEIDMPDLCLLDVTICNSPSCMTFDTNAISEVYSLAAGTVVAVICIGDIQGIIIKYGDYHVVYSGLSISYVQKGDNVLEGKKIGRLISYSENEYRLEVCLSFKNILVENMERWFSRDLMKYVKGGLNSNSN